MKRSRATRRSARAIDLNHSDIKYDTTCIDIVPGDFPLSLACEICHGKLDIHTKKSSQNLTNRYKQYWMSKWSNQNIGLLTKHNFTRRYLNIKQDVKIQFEEY